MTGTRRGEQLTRLLVSRYLSDFVGQPVKWSSIAPILHYSETYVTPMSAFDAAASDA
jgi:hypothetical protein